MLSPLPLWQTPKTCNPFWYLTYKSDDLPFVCHIKDEKIPWLGGGLLLHLWSYHHHHHHHHDVLDLLHII
jgi:hypothetical protein